MFVKRFFEPSIAQASYMIGCHANGEALVIDANRDVDQYIQTAAQEGLRITHVTETHIHADYVSGSRELAHKTGATLLLSDEGDADWKYAFINEGKPLHHGDRLQIGNIRVDVLHTPGHTPEHLTFLITDGAAADQPIAAVTGDFVFVGDVGRPDLLERAANIKGTMEVGAKTLWKSLQAFAVHEDWLQIWPGHGAGSACGNVKTEADFVTRVLEGQPEPPTYFASMKRVNKAGPALLGKLPTPPKLADSQLVELLAAGALVIDTRPADEFADQHVPGTLNIPLNSSFVTWVGWLVPPAADLYLVVDEATAARLPEVSRLLALIGIDRITGWIGTSAVTASAVLRRTPQMSPTDLQARLSAGAVTVIDVRSANEWAGGHVPGALHIPLGHLADRCRTIPTTKPVVMQCQGGSRSAIAASVLERLGFPNVINLAGGFSAWTSAGLPVEGASHEPQAARA